MSEPEPAKNDGGEKKYPVAAPTIPDYYANVIRVRTAMHDFALLLGCSVPLGPESAEMIDWRLRVMMSPSHAKALMLVLMMNVGVYEKRWGVIPISDEIKAGMTKLEELSNALASARTSAPKARARKKARA